jgi:hypothetical protein
MHCENGSIALAGLIEFSAARARRTPFLDIFPT